MDTDIFYVKKNFLLSHFYFKLFAQLFKCFEYCFFFKLSLIIRLQILKCTRFKAGNYISTLLIIFLQEKYDIR